MPRNTCGKPIKNGKDKSEKMAEELEEKAEKKAEIKSEKKPMPRKRH